MGKVLILILLLCSSLTFSKEPIVVGSKSFSESVILGEMISVLLEEKFNHPVIRKLNLGGTKVAFDALNSESIHVYPDYTGTGYVMILKMEGERDPSKVHKIVNREFQSRYGIEWSGSIGFNNTYALTVRNSDKRFSNIENISQLFGKVQDYKYGAAYEFMERKDGHPRFVKQYDLNFRPGNVISMEAGLMYSAIKDKQIDMIISYSTDGRIKAYDLKIIRDDLNFFPPYMAALLGKTSVLKKFPALKEVFSIMEDLIDEDEMTELNDQVDRLKREPKEVAQNFLIEKGIIKGVKKEFKSDKLFLGYFYKKRKYVLKLLGEHLLLSFGALFFAFLVSVPTGILLTRHEKLGKIVFPIVNTIQTIPSLALLGFLIPFLGIGFAPAVLALFLYSLLPLIRNTYTGIVGVDRNFVEASKGIGLTNFQILVKVELPLAMPVILAGIRTAAVIVIGTATLAALVGAGGFGDPIFRGVSTVNSNLILLGAIPAATLAVIVDKIIGVIEPLVVSKGIRIKHKK